MRRFRESLATDPVRWSLVADDLTGAADSAVAFAAAGFETVLALNDHALDALEGELLAVSTDTRDSGAKEGVRRVNEVCAKLIAADRPIVFKKVDSLLRGHVGEETVATLDACGFATAVLCPALPREGRLVVNGRAEAQHQDGGRHLPRSQRFLTPDASSDEDLRLLAARLLDLVPPALPAGSAGLAFAWAQTLAALRGRKPARGTAPRTDLPLALVIGSTHDRTIRQLDRLRGLRDVALTPLENLPAHVWDKRDLVIRVPPSNADPALLAPLAGRLAAGACGGLLLSGGATAEWALAKLEARAIEIRGEAISGCPWGKLRGGAADGAVVVTKSGAFGQADGLIRIADFLHGRQSNR